MMGTLQLVCLCVAVCAHVCASQRYVTPVPSRYQADPEGYTGYSGYSTPRVQLVRAEGRVRDQSREPGQQLEEEEPVEEPDRLSELLASTKFDCVGRTTGYYADEKLGCEVFHYCQDGARHSWICPDGFAFHQVHLICMPRASEDDFCSRSSRFHIVNDYLYRPINEEEVRRQPNVTLRYSDRFFPETYRAGQEHETEVEVEEEPQPQQHRPQPQLVRHQPQPQQHRPQHQPQLRSQPTLRPQLQPQHVFRSPEEVNISLQQRRPPQQLLAYYH